ncbi:high affinity nerve growth factor receptor [Striga asiatica]|uniref:High affinity nerve growth factor receptor n=1 Tax=Striga asiatica TaxID=4170 RepID=A0A5A7QKP8_STRAF|nr:high affinity nerve growth factor receptor [Striga asiatica]
MEAPPTTGAAPSVSATTYLIPPTAAIVSSSLSHLLPPRPNFSYMNESSAHHNRRSVSLRQCLPNTSDHRPLLSSLSHLLPPLHEQKTLPTTTAASSVSATASPTTPTAAVVFSSLSHLLPPPSTSRPSFAVART